MLHEPYICKKCRQQIGANKIHYHENCLNVQIKNLRKAIDEAIEALQAIEVCTDELIISECAESAKQTLMKAVQEKA